MRRAGALSLRRDPSPPPRRLNSVCTQFHADICTSSRIEMDNGYLSMYREVSPLSLSEVDFIVFGNAGPWSKYTRRIRGLA